MTVTTYAEFDKLLHRGNKPVPSRKIANHTYAQRRHNCCESPARMYHDGEVTYLDCIAIMFHKTDVVTFHNDDSITLNTGGWITHATSERINRFTPPSVTLYSVAGRWYVRHRLGFSPTVPLEAPTSPFCDEMHLVPLPSRSGDVRSWHVVTGSGLDPVERKRQDAHNRRIEKLLDAYLRWLTPERYQVLTLRGQGLHGAQCGMCVRTSVGILVGDSFEDKQHLIEHLIDKDVPFAVFHVACDHGRGGDDGLARTRHFDLAKRDLRKYLRQQLYVGPVAIKGGKRPAHTEPWSLTARLRGKSA